MARKAKGGGKYRGWLVLSSDLAGEDVRKERKCDSERAGRDLVRSLNSEDDARLYWLEFWGTSSILSSRLLEAEEVPIS